jgi:hypothetical protein
VHLDGWAGRIDTRAGRRALWFLIAATSLASLLALNTNADARQRQRAAAPARPVVTSTSLRTTTSSTTTTTSTTLPPTTEAPTTTAPPPPPPPPPAPVPAIAAFNPATALQAPGAFTFDPYAGLGTWIDVYDWSETYGGGAVGPADIDRMAALGVQTVYIQATRWDAATVILEPERLLALIKRARARGMRVVGWYLPDLSDLNNDMQRLTAIASLPIDGLGIDIESRSVEDVNARNQQLLSLSAWLRSQLPGQVLSAIVLPPVIMEDINPNYWPDYPWAGLAQYYDVWQPMSYWSVRRDQWRDAYLYTATNIDRIREHIGKPDAVVHPIGGIGDESNSDDITAFDNAVFDRGCIGASLYDYRTTGDDLWPGLQQLRAQ